MSASVSEDGWMRPSVHNVHCRHHRWERYPLCRDFRKFPWRASALLIAWLLPGCGAPLNFGPSLPFSQERSNSDPLPAPHTTSTPQRQAGEHPHDLASIHGATGDALTVQVETLAASAIWNGETDALRTGCGALAAEQWQPFVAARASKLVVDRVAESLLFQKATLRLDKNAQSRIDEIIEAEIRKKVAAEFEGSHRQYERHLAQEGRTLDQVRSELRRRFTIAGFLESELKPKVVPPTRDQLYAAYERMQGTGRRAPRRAMSLIEVRVNEFLPEGNSEPSRPQSDWARASARSRIEAAAADLQNGADFAEVARRYSHGLHADDGGRWGWITLEAVRPRFATAVTALQQLQPGEVSGVVETPDAFFLVRCDEFDPGTGSMDFQTVQPELEESLIQAEYNRLISEFVEELRKSAGINSQDLERFHRAVVDAGLVLCQERAE